MSSNFYSYQILMKHEYSRHSFEKYPKISNFMKIRPVGAKFHAHGRTEITKLTVAFRNFANAPKNSFVAHPNEVCF